MDDPVGDASEDLLNQAARGDAAACGELLARYRERLRRLVASRLDSRLAARVDASDVVQEALAEAHRLLPAYLRDRPLPFYPWLRQIACNRLIDLYRHHVLAGKRSIAREEHAPLALSQDSTLELARRLADPGSSPSGRLCREERCGQARRALLLLADQDREVLVLRYLEQLSTKEIAAVLGIQEGAVKVRHFRALQRMRALLDRLSEEPS